MTTKDTGQHIPSGRHPHPAGKVDFTFMYAAHDAFHRDLRRLAAAAQAVAHLAPTLRTPRWIPDAATAGPRKGLLGMPPAPARLLYRAVWRPGYARTPRWEH